MDTVKKDLAAASAQLVRALKDLEQEGANHLGDAPLDSIYTRVTSALWSIDDARKRMGLKPRKAQGAT